jgi:hypothetical protein
MFATVPISQQWSSCLGAWNYADRTNLETSPRAAQTDRIRTGGRNNTIAACAKKGVASTRAVDERHAKRHEVVAAERQRVREFAPVEALHERVQQQQASEVHGDALESVDVGRVERRPQQWLCREPHRNDDADGVHDDGRDVAGQQAETNDCRTPAKRPGVMQQRECHHRKRRDHEVHPGAGLLDQKHTFRREVAFTGDRRERDAGHQANERARSA